MPCNKCCSLIANFELKAIFFLQPVLYKKTFFICEKKQIPLIYHENINYLKSHLREDDEELYDAYFKYKGDNFPFFINEARVEKFDQISKAVKNIELPWKDNTSSDFTDNNATYQIPIEFKITMSKLVEICSREKYKRIHGTQGNISSPMGSAKFVPTKIKENYFWINPWEKNL